MNNKRSTKMRNKHSTIQIRFKLLSVKRNRKSEIRLSTNRQISGTVPSCLQPVSSAEINK